MQRMRLRQKYAALSLVRALLWLGVAVCVACHFAAAHAAGPGAQIAKRGSKLTERSKQKTVAETERTQLQQKLGALKQEINRTEAAKDDAVDALAASEDAVSDANRSLRELSNEEKRTETKISQLAREHQRLSNVVLQQKEQLAKLLRGQYVAGNEDRIKLLLSGDNPSRINRDLQYLGYLSQAQAQLLANLRANLRAVEGNQAETENAKDEIIEIADDARIQKAILENEKTRRSALFAQLSKRLQAQRKQVGTLERNDQRLAGLVDKLSQLIEEQKKADTAALEKRRQQQLAEAKARAQAQAQAKLERLARIKADKLRRLSQHASGKLRSASAAQQEKSKLQDRIDDDEAPKQLAQNTLNNELTPLIAVQRERFASLRGQLRLPVRGAIVAKFGSKRGDGPNSKGLFIRAGEGAQIKAVANGTVVFAEWLRGFGNLIIIDHGSQYLTIYGNNQTLFKRVGDAVKGGEAIANAGNSGSNDESGLYFEMRHQGSAFDPLKWVTIK
jgi:septal ring factor EnvC (AmiA/AmiB activator)